jgi:hypothetical protein
LYEPCDTSEIHNGFNGIAVIDLVTAYIENDQAVKQFENIG